MDTTTEIAKVGEVSLVNFDKARQALTLAHSIDEVKQIRDQAEAIRQYIRQQKGSLEMQNQAAEIKIRAERRAGEMLKEQSRKPGDTDKSIISHDVILLPKLSELDITPMQSHRWQLEADVPEEKVEEFIARAREKSEELTSRAILGEAMKMKHEEKKQATSEGTIPEGLFQVIVIDPPWPYGRTYDPYSSRVASPYEEQSIEQLWYLDVPAADDCALWLWTTNTFLHDAYHILAAWVFEPKTILTWYKERTGVGHWLRGDTEHCILAIKGKPTITHVAQSSFLSAKAGEHSAKPDAFYTLVESLCPGNKLDMYSRKQRDGWESHGNQL